MLATDHIGEGRAARPMLPRLATWIGRILLAVGIMLTAIWCSLAAWYRFPAGEAVRGLLGAAILVFGAITIAWLSRPRRWLALAVYFGFFVLFLGWWATIKPTNARNWAPDVARTATASIDGDQLVVTNVRNFAWRSENDFDQRWERRTYDLSQVANVDLIMSYWAGEAIAHTIISFGFEDGRRLAFSIETRKESPEGYSSVAGFFKQYELAVIAADERDVVRLRSNIRGEDVRIFRLRMTPENARLLLREYVDEVNDLAREPRFYNTLTANCTNLVFDMVRAIHPGLPMDARVLFSGYLPSYVYDLGAADTSMPFERLRALAKIHDKAARADADPLFSAKIRQNLPVPQ